VYGVSQGAISEKFTPSLPSFTDNRELFAFAFPKLEKTVGILAQDEDYFLVDLADFNIHETLFAGENIRSLTTTSTDTEIIAIYFDLDTQVTKMRRINVSDYSSTEKVVSQKVLESTVDVVGDYVLFNDCPSCIDSPRDMKVIDPAGQVKSLSEDKRQGRVIKLQY
jgi:hypothetical protein